jgi:hypothetical protein
MVSSLRRRVAPAVIVIIMAMVAIIGQAVLTTTHFNDAEAGTFGCGHASQSIHEIPAPAHWPGTRAAHTVWISPGGDRNQSVYTKSGWWDPTWDFYYTSFKLC